MNELASRYASALFSIKRETNKLLETQEEIKELIKILKDNPDYILILKNKSMNIAKRIELMEEAFVKVDEDIVNLIKIVITNDRSEYLLDIFQDFSSMVNEYRHISEGLLYSSEPLSEAEINKIESSVSEKENHPVSLKNIIDPSLIGGVKVVINGHIYDGSIKHHIEQMKNALLK